MSLFAELKRRNVFRVGIAYVVVSWLVLQVCDVILNNIEAPGWVFRVILLLLAVGFPVILVFAWAFELTPEGIKREKQADRSESITPQTGARLNRVITMALNAALAYIAVDKFFLGETRDKAGSPETVATSQQPAADAADNTAPAKSIAVLPFSNRSANNENAIRQSVVENLGSTPIFSRLSGSCPTWERPTCVFDPGNGN
jgi:hypothetical protein